MEIRSFHRLFYIYIYILSFNVGSRKVSATFGACGLIHTESMRVEHIESHKQRCDTKSKAEHMIHILFAFQT